MTSSTNLRHRAIAVIAAVMTVLASCSGGSGGDDAAVAAGNVTTSTSAKVKTTTATATATATATVEDTTTSTAPAPDPAEDDQLQVASTAYVAALRIDLAEASVDGAAGEIVLTGRVTNEKSFDSSTADINGRTAVTLEMGDSRVEVMHDLQPTPTGSSTPFRWTAPLPDEESVDLKAARLVRGAGTENQSVIPFGGGAVETVPAVSGFADDLSVSTSAVQLDV